MSVMKLVVDGKFNEEEFHYEAGIGKGEGESLLVIHAEPIREEGKTKEIESNVAFVGNSYVIARAIAEFLGSDRAKAIRDEFLEGFANALRGVVMEKIMDTIVKEAEAGDTTH